MTPSDPGDDTPGGDTPGGERPDDATVFSSPGVSRPPSRSEPAPPDGPAAHEDSSPEDDSDVTRFAPAPPPEPPAAPDLETRPSGGTIPINAVISHTYRIESLLAMGGMGEVYRARHLFNQRLYALKMIKPEFASDDRIIALFRREAGILESIRNPVIVGYSGLVLDENTHPFIVMEYVDGPSLADLIGTRTFTLADIRMLRDTLASALDETHRAGVVHRDISPDNIVLQDGQIDQPRIIDFGIARQEAAATTIIGDGFAGKYRYASPEQLGAYGGQVDGRSDIYSLGLVLAAIARGEPLDMGQTPTEVLARRATVPDLAGVPEDLWPDLTVMLEPDPADRPVEARSLIGHGVGAGGDGSAREASTSGGGRPRRSALIPALWGLLMLLAGGGLGALAWHEGWITIPGLDRSGSPPLTVDGTGQDRPESPATAESEANDSGVEEPPTPDTAATTIAESPAETPANTPADTGGEQVALRPPVPDPAALTRDLPCSSLSVAFEADMTARVAGYLETSDDLDRLRARLADVPEVTGIDTSAVAVAPRPLCAILGTLDAWRFTDGPIIHVGNGSGRYAVGDFLTLSIEPTLPRAHLHVVYIDATERLALHMLPNPVRRDTRAQAGVTVEIGEPGPSPSGVPRAYEMAPPVGRQMVLVAQGPEPLFEGDLRPEVEPLQDFLNAMLSAEADAGPMLRFSYAFVDIVP
ncbi:protein kinase [Roseospira marina]|uniref:Protein kinase n=1 Tax=Roseospira marina TaxID=140057 RepID=A0A5M6ICM2_9PROT|nr:serine/threonine protein kinase [Roseospira marina]KAA5605953.1 protein kinase [Roseospira marina]MBB4313201.1 putative Ser/Thr protein kinase [Roseospira marina]MBB5086058.1 putative Ser/Thr protein kinase [Roseospira marina]